MNTIDYPILDIVGVDYRVINNILGGFSDLFLPFIVLVTGGFVGILGGRLSRRLLVTAGLPDMVEETRFEQMMHRLGTSTVGMCSTLIAVVIIALAVGVVLRIGGILNMEPLLDELPTYLLQIFVATLALIIGLITADKAKIGIQDQFESVKYPKMSFFAPEIIKYTIIFVASIIALSQLGVMTGPLLVLLGGYVFALVVLSGLALKDLIPAGAAGMYLLLTHPYEVGDTIDIDGHRGIVQDIDIFVTHIENDNKEVILPNHLVLRSGIIRIRTM